jgi:hypothetical protein
MRAFSHKWFPGRDVTTRSMAEALFWKMIFRKTAGGGGQWRATAFK